MGLEIVWRNRTPLEKRKTQLERIMMDEFGALYAVTRPDEKSLSFEVLMGGVARKTAHSEVGRGRTEMGGQEKWQA